MLSISFRPKKTKSHQTAHYIPVWVAAFLSSPALCLRTSRTESLHLPPPHPGAHPRASSPSPPLAQREKSLAQLWVLSLQEPLHFLFSRGCLRRMASWTMYSGAKWAASSPPNQLALHLNNLGYLERGWCNICGGNAFCFLLLSPSHCTQAQAGDEERVLVFGTYTTNQVAWWLWRGGLPAPHKSGVINISPRSLAVSKRTLFESVHSRTRETLQDHLVQKFCPNASWKLPQNLLRAGRKGQRFTKSIGLCFDFSGALEFHLRVFFFLSQMTLS